MISISRSWIRDSLVPIQSASFFISSLLYQISWRLTRELIKFPLLNWFCRLGLSGHSGGLARHSTAHGAVRPFWNNDLAPLKPAPCALRVPLHFLYYYYNFLLVRSIIVKKKRGILRRLTHHMMYFETFQMFLGLFKLSPWEIFNHSLMWKKMK